MSSPIRIKLSLAALLSFLSCAAHAQETPAAPLPYPHGEVADDKPVTISQGAVSVTLDLARVKRDKTPRAVVKVDGKEALRFAADGNYISFGAHVRIVRLDPASALPQVVFSRYTGGAHCCADTLIGTQTGGKWRIVKAGQRDGEEGFTYEDIDGDGTFEIVGVDNSFLYRFDSYASSNAATQIYQLRGDKLVDVTRDARFAKKLRTDLQRMEKDANENPDSWSSNGFLAGWVAQKALVGETADAWKRMLQNYERGNVSGLPCEEGKKRPPPACRDPEQRAKMFPGALRDFLVKSGYLAANDTATR